MNHSRKNVFTVTLDASKGETPDLLMTALAMAIFDLAPPLHDDESGIADERYGKSDALTEEEAERFVLNGREVVMMFPKARMCVAHVFATRLTPSECEIVLTMGDFDGDKLLDRASRSLDKLVADRATDIDLEDIFIEVDEDAVTQRISA